MPDWIKWLGVPLAVGVLTALISAVAPATYERLRNQTDLQYDVQASPVVNTRVETKAIYSVTVTNAGATSISDAILKVRLPNGTIAFMQ